MKYLSQLMAGSVLFLAVSAHPDSQPVTDSQPANACKPYREAISKISAEFAHDELFRQLDLRVNTRLASVKARKGLANMSKNFDAWFTPETVTLNVSDELCEMNLSADALSVAVCHEYGHLLGGPPYISSSFKFDLDRLKTDKQKRWELWTAEGQSDYWATLKCLPVAWDRDDNQGWLSRQTLGPEFKYAVRDCNAYHGEGTNRAAICIRSIVAGTELLQALQKRAFERQIAEDDENYAKGYPVVLTPKQRAAGAILPQPDELADFKVARTIHQGYPQAQCRLDTYFAGALCPMPLMRGVNYGDAGWGVCLTSGAFPKGARPACWFNEERSLGRGVKEHGG